jgi:pre-rRNA-processing protein IPI3
MLSLVEQHVREISALRLSSCGHFLATGSLDGAVKMFLTAKFASKMPFKSVYKSILSLITPREEGGGRDQPIGGHSAHSLPVNELFISSGLGPRLLSVSEDHTAALFSLATRQILLKITSDRPLTACCMDWAETRLFLGAGNGRICAVDIQSEVFLEGENNEKPF